MYFTEPEIKPGQSIASHVPISRNMACSRTQQLSGNINVGGRYGTIDQADLSPPAVTKAAADLSGRRDR